MIKKLPRRRNSRQPFLDGQIWELDGSKIHISKVGKTLVHYKHFRGELKRAAVSLANKQSLDEYLITKKAVLARS